MEEKQVNVVIAPVNGYAFLPIEEGEVVAQLGDEVLQLGYYCRFEVAFGIISVKAKVIEEVRVAEDEVLRQFAFSAQLLEVFRDDLVWFFGNRRALVEHRLDAAAQRARVPIVHLTHLDVEVAFERLVDVHDDLDTRPVQFSPQRGEKLVVRERAGQMSAVAKLLGAPSASIRLC